MENERICYRRLDLKIIIKEWADLLHAPKFQVYIIGFLSRTRYCDPDGLKVLKKDIRRLARKKCELTCDRAGCKSRRIRLNSTN